VGARTLGNLSKKPGYKAEILGGRYFSPDFETKLAEYIMYFRSRKQPVFKEDVLEFEMFERADQALPQLVGDTLTSGWYYNFLNRAGFGTAEDKPIDVTRTEWCTSGNLKL
jgi:hypothetical protein